MESELEKVKRLMGLKPKQLNENRHKVNEYGCVMLYFKFSEFKDVQSKIVKGDLYNDPDDDSYGLESEPHITALYGLHDTIKDDEIKNIVEKFDFSESVTVHKISLFKNDKYEVLKFEAVKEGNELVKCNKELKKLPNTNSFPNYNPHLTIAYILPNKGDKYVEMFKDKKYKLEPTKIVYSKTDGSKITYKI